MALAITVLGTSTTTVAEAPVPLHEPVAVTLTINEVTEVTFKDRLLKATIDERRTLVHDKIIELAAKHGANGEQVYGTIARCENNTLDPDRQSEHRYTYDNPKWGTVAGERERSFGLAQIHLPSHPTITKAQATDPEWALEWMTKEFARGNQTAWSCWKKLYGVQ